MSNIVKKMMMAAGAGTEDFWISLIGSGVEDYFNAVAVDSSDNIISVGRSDQDSLGFFSAFIVKQNPDGSVAWSKELTGTGTEQFFDVVTDSSDNIIVSGSLTTGSAGNHDVLIAKYNSSGALQWQRKIGQTRADYGYSLAIDSADNVIVAGQYSYSSGYVAGYVIKYNSSGVFQWDKIYGFDNYETRFRSVAVDSLNNIIVAGITDYVVSGAHDALVMKLDSAGSISWEQRWNGDSISSDQFLAVEVDSSDNIYLSGSVNSSGAKNVVMKLNSSGVSQWQTFYSGLEGSGDLLVSEDGEVYQVGFTSFFGEGFFDLFILKYDSSGSLLWSNVLGYTGDDRGMGVSVTSFGSLVVVGQINGVGAGNDDALSAKLPSDGSGLGTYGSIVYQAFSPSSASVSLSVESAIRFSATDVSATEGAAGLTDASISFTQSLTAI